MTWVVVILLAAAYIALMLKVAHWIGGLLAEASIFFERENACTCTRHRLCAACLARLQPSPRDEGQPAREKAA